MSLLILLYYTLALAFESKVLHFRIYIVLTIDASDNLSHLQKKVSEMEKKSESIEIFISF